MPMSSSQEALTRGTRRFYNDIQVNDRNLALSGGSGVVDHHFGIGVWNVNQIDTMTQDEISGAIRQLEEAQARMLISKMKPVGAEDRVLDAGCGRGGTAIRLHEETGARVEGITIAPYQARFAAGEVGRRGYGGMHFTEMNMLRQAFAPETFDQVVTNETTMYVLNLEKLFGEFRRVLKPGGRYTLATWNINEAYRGAEGQTAEKFVNPINDHYGVRMHTDAAYKGALDKTGFDITEDVDLTHLVIPHWVLRTKWERASGVEQPFLEGHRERAILYKMISAKLR